MPLTSRDMEKKRAKDLAEALAAKPADPSFMKKPPVESNPDYIPPPLVDVQAKLEQARKASVALNQKTVEDIKVSMEDEIRRGAEPPSQEVTEASRSESVDYIKAQLRRQPKVDLSEVAVRNNAAHEENVDLIKAEMLNSIRNEPYSG
jgi:hypothetical protein